MKLTLLAIALLALTGCNSSPPVQVDKSVTVHQWSLYATSSVDYEQTSEVGVDGNSSDQTTPIDLSIPLTP